MILLILMMGAFFASLLSGAAGFGGSLLLLPIVTVSIGAEKAIPVLTIAQLLGNIARVSTGWKQIKWKEVGLFLCSALPLTALGAFGFSVLPKGIVNRCVGVLLIVFVILKWKKILNLKNGKKTLLIGGAFTGGLSGLVGSGGPIGAAVFLSLDLSPVSYIASEAATAVAMHVLKTVIYSKLANMTFVDFMTGILMGISMFAGTYAANYFIKNMNKNKFQKYVAVLLCLFGIYMMLYGGS